MNIFVYNREGFPPVNIPDRHFNTTDVLEHADCMVVVGGDGTLLEAARYICEHGQFDLPIVGYNSGHLGFLSNDMQVSGLLRALEDIDAGNTCRIQERCVLEITGKHCKNKLYAFNEVLFLPQVSSLFEVNMSLERSKEGDSAQLRYTADGIIVSTATGSTAHNLSAGGPIMFPELNAMLVTPICPFSLSARSIVLPGVDMILRVLIPSSARMVLDGVEFTIPEKSVSSIRTAKKTLRVYKVDDFVDAITTKLGWNYNIR